MKLSNLATICAIITATVVQTAPIPAPGPVPEPKFFNGESHKRDPIQVERDIPHIQEREVDHGKREPINRPYTPDFTGQWENPGKRDVNILLCNYSLIINALYQDEPEHIYTEVEKRDPEPINRPYTPDFTGQWENPGRRDPEPINRPYTPDFTGQWENPGKRAPINRPYTPDFTGQWENPGKRDPINRPYTPDFTGQWENPGKRDEEPVHYYTHFEERDPQRAKRPYTPNFTGQWENPGKREVNITYLLGEKLRYLKLPTQKPEPVRPYTHFNEHRDPEPINRPYTPNFTGQWENPGK
ncbi:hypothetical protein HDU99_002005 [Rhizoclosmatium hyalinum]|nr:hypothetical protein HDU99_002005 [Rhizoclosmatium hyalinum]